MHQRAISAAVDTGNGARAGGGIEAADTTGRTNTADGSNANVADTSIGPAAASVSPATDE